MAAHLRRFEVNCVIESADCFGRRSRNNTLRRRLAALAKLKNVRIFHSGKDRRAILTRLVLASGISIVSFNQGWSKAPSYNQYYDRAALLLQASSNSESFSVEEGKVHWTELLTGKSLADTSLQAMILIPSSNLNLKMTASRNNNILIPCSIHILLKFDFRSISSNNSVSDIRMMQTRKNDDDLGQNLSGNYKSIGHEDFEFCLTKGDVEAKNIDMIKSSNWIDLPLMFQSGKRGKITFEKGMDGQRLWDIVLQRWGM